MKTFREFIFSPTGILLIPILIIIFVLLSNLDTILDKMGFETRAHLKSELTKARYTMNLLQEDLNELKFQQKMIVNQCLIKEEIVTEYVKEADSIDNYIKDIITSNVIKGPLIRTEEKKEDVSEEIVEDTPHPKNLPKIDLKNDNIIALNKVYNELFGG